MEQDNLLLLREDIPESKPGFDFDLLADSLVGVIEQERTHAFVLGLHGPWGAGKTTLLNALRDRLTVQAPFSPTVIEFNAWKYQDREALWRALIIRVLAALRESGADEKKLTEIERALYESFIAKDRGPLSVNWKGLITEGLITALHLSQLGVVAGAAKGVLTWVSNGLLGKTSQKDEDTSKRVERITGILERKTLERSVQQLVSIEQFLEKFRGLVADLVTRKGRIYVLIDDLDRCLPESALDIFEAIKLFLDARGCTFVVAVDRDVIRRGLAVRYRESNLPGGESVVDPDEYIEKTISLSFDVPVLDIEDAKGMMLSYRLPIELTQDQLDHVVASLGTTPRRIKRFMNSLALNISIATRPRGAGRDMAESPLDPDNIGLFLKQSLIAYRNSGVFGLMLRDPALAIRLQEAANVYEAKLAESTQAAQEELNKRLKDEHALVRETKTDRILWNTLNLPPKFTADPKRVQRMFRWYRSKMGVPQLAEGARENANA